MSSVSRYFRDLRKNWEPSGIGYEVRRSSGAFLILIFIGFLVCRLRPDILDAIMEFVLSVFASADVYTEDGSISAAGLFFNNVRACLMTALYGILPFLYFPAFSLGVNSMLLGVMAAYYLSVGHSLPLYLAGILPHGIFELPALVMSIACGLFLCRQVSDHILGKQTAAPISAGIVLTAQIFLLLIIPLLALAALAEAYVTPLVMNLFL